MTSPSPTPRKKIGLAAVNAIPPSTTIWDSDLKGFCIRRQKSDAVSYMLKTRILGRIRWFTIGRHGQPWTPETARQRAREIVANPTVADTAAPTVPLTIGVVADQFMDTHGPKLKRSTRYVYQCLIRTYIKPAFGEQAITALTRAAVSAAHAKWKNNPRSANHALAVLSKLMSWAEDQGYRPEDSNPCRRVQRYKESKREKFLTAAELGRLGAALDKAETEHLTGTYAVAAIRLLVLTGARLNEILTLQWTHVDLDRRMAFLPDSKTGQKPLHLNDPAIAVLTSLPRFANNPYVICGNRHGMHLINLQKPWHVVRALAGLDDVRVHDLRHTFASVSVAQGGSLPMIGAILGHTQPQTTQRYAHLTADPVRQLSQATGQALAAALARRP